MNSVQDEHVRRPPSTPVRLTQVRYHVAQDRRCADSHLLVFSRQASFRRYGSTTTSLGSLHGCQDKNLLTRLCRTNRESTHEYYWQPFFVVGLLVLWLDGEVRRHVVDSSQCLHHAASGTRLVTLCCSFAFMLTEGSSNWSRALPRFSGCSWEIFVACSHDVCTHHFLPKLSEHHHHRSVCSRPVRLVSQQQSHRVYHFVQVPVVLAPRPASYPQETC